MTVSNSCETKILKFDDAVGVLLSEEARKKSSKSAETSRSALSVDRRGRSTKREKNGKSKSKSRRRNSKSRGVRCWRCGKKGHIQRDYKQKKDGKGKSKKEGSR